MTKLRILLADDHETVREGLKAILNVQSDMEVVGAVPDGRGAVDQSMSLHPDILVLDVSMPDLNGLRVTEAVRECCPNVKVLMLTRHGDDGFVQQLMRAGACGYVLKQSRATELLSAIRAVAAGGTYLDPAVAGRVVADYKRRTAPAFAGPTLSGREEEILRLVAWGYSNKEIAAQLDLSVKTIETHKINATHKAGLHNRTDIVRYALLQGWLKDL